ncbi:hypothetical protein HaLaN_17282, partial [Haematococcus lacustris]
AQVVWRVDPLRGTLTFQGLVLQDLPMGRASNMPWGSIGWGIWAVSAERCNASLQSVRVINSTLIMPRTTLDYVVHWFQQYGSLSRSVTLSGWPGVMTVLDWQGLADQLLLTSAASLTLRNLVIMNGAPQSAPALAQTLVKPELAPYTGPFILHRDQLSLTLQQAVKVVLWPAAFDAVKQVSGFHSMPQVPGSALPPELMVYSSALGEASFLGVDVTLLSLAAGDAALGLPYPSLPPPVATAVTPAEARRVIRLGRHTQ